jgi:hypothetical protein
MFYVQARLHDLSISQAECFMHETVSMFCPQAKLHVFPPLVNIDYSNY